MKITLIVFGIIAVLVIAVIIYTMSYQKGIETYPYQVIKKYENFEVRQYEASLFTSYKMPTSKYEEASSKGFRSLAGYIFGGNDKNEKIAMTSPVSVSLSDSMTMMFMVPKELKKENLPKPNQNDIEFKEVPAKKVAAITFGGWADSTKIEKYKQKLINYLTAENIAFTNIFYFLGYNAPFELVGRKNDIIVELH